MIYRYFLGFVWKQKLKMDSFLSVCTRNLWPGIYDENMTDNLSFGRR